MENNEIFEKIIGSAIEVHRTLGPVLLESADQECLIFELKSLGFQVEKEKTLPHYLQRNETGSRVQN
jgi:GxxExxY protein